ncbi:MAG: PD-(D/E)XK nuclease family protein [Methanobrevibacter sp.]|jgi:hypothetical protein|nr:PD-(D/E)XK nuclease family protein [Candidatus Methanoflexus mossambicus]
MSKSKHHKNNAKDEKNEKDENFIIKVSPKSKDYLIPEYNLTGDILSFLTCNLQYRYQNKGSLPPSKPLQLWFGEFLHGVMEEAYIHWELNKTPFPWDWREDIRPIEEKIDERLQTRGLYPPSERFYSPYKILDHVNGNYKKNENPKKRIMSERIEKSINIWGKEIFPLMKDAEVAISGVRKLPEFKNDLKRAEFYSINGVIDVLSSLKINQLLSQNNILLNYLRKNKDINQYFKTLDVNLINEYEIIIDYKGMKRPNKTNERWKEHESQILTYSWLRRHLNDDKPIIAGIIFYLNELVPSTKDLKEIRQDIIDNKIDKSVKNIPDDDLKKIIDWNCEEKTFPVLSDEFKINRSIRIITIDETTIDNALNEFDSVVGEIECCLIKEAQGIPIKSVWKAIPDERTCDVCDFRNFCNEYKNKKDKTFSIP